MRNGLARETALARRVRAMRRNAGTLTLLAALASHLSANDPGVNDPLESSNRAVFKANDAMDRAVIKLCISHERANLLNHAIECMIEPGRWVSTVVVCG